MAEDGKQPQRIPRDADEGDDNGNDASNTNKRSRKALMDSSKRSKHGHDDEEEQEEIQGTTEDSKQDVNGREDARDDDDDDDDDEEESEESESDEESSEEEGSGGEAERSARAAGTSERRSIVVNLGPSTLPPAKPPAPPPTPIEPTGNDVLFAPRHVEFRQCPGNQKLNFLVKREGPRYHASDYATKTMMIQGVVALLRQLEPPGRFLKYEQHTKNWIECSDEYAHMQVLSMFARQLKDDSLLNSGESQNDNDEGDGGDDSGAEEPGGSNHQSGGDSGGSNQAQNSQPQDGTEGDDRKPRARDPQTDNAGDYQYQLNAITVTPPTLIEPVGRRISDRCVDGVMEEKDDNDGFHYTGYRGRGLTMASLNAAVQSLIDSEVASEDAETISAQCARNKMKSKERLKSALVRGSLHAQAAKANLSAVVKSFEFVETDAVQFSSRDDASRGNPRAAMDSAEDDGMVALERAWMRGIMLEPRRTAPLASQAPLSVHVQSEPRNLVEPWDKPRHPGQKDRHPILPGVFPYSAPKCGSRPFEVAKAAAAAILEHSASRAAGGQTKISGGVTEGASKFITKTTTNDVLTGRNHSRLDHVGNLRCREAVRQSVDQYIMATSIADKNEVIDEIRCYVEEKGGRFLKHKIGWKELTVESARRYITELMFAAILERGQKQEKQKTESTRRAHCGSSQSEVMPEFEYRGERTEQSIRDEGQRSFDRTAVASSLDTDAVGLDLDDAFQEEEEEVARVNETGFEDAVVEVALYNYECFYGLKPGTAFFDLVQSTSAGIEGWASSVLTEERQRWGMDEPSREETIAPANQRKGDQEEDRMLRDALLESVGAKPYSQQNIQTNEEWDDETDNNYCDDDNSSCSSEGEWSKEAYENEDLHFDEERPARNLLNASNEKTKRTDSEPEADAISVERLRDSKKEEKSSSGAGAVLLEETPTIKIQEESTSSSDDESWSEVSKSDGDLSDGVLVNPEDDSDITDGSHR